MDWGSKSGQETSDLPSAKSANEVGINQDVQKTTQNLWFLSVVGSSLVGKTGSLISSSVL